MLTESQLHELEREFHTSIYPSQLRRIQMARALNMTERQIKIWFQNRRRKYRREQNAQTRTNELEEGQPLPISMILRRTRFTQSKLQLLEREFHTRMYPSKLRIKQITEALNETEYRIIKWFDNRREKYRKKQNAHASSSSTSTGSSTHHPNEETTTILRERCDYLTRNPRTCSQSPSCSTPRVSPATHSFGIQTGTNELEEVQPSPISMTLRRTRFTESKLQLLEREFHTSKYPSKLRRKQITEALNETECRITHWFKNRREKYRKEQNAHASSSSTSTGSSTHHPKEKTRTSLRARCDGLRGNPRIFSQSPPPSLPRLSTPTNPPTACNTPLSPTLGQLNYDTPCYPLVNSQTYYPNAITRGLKTSFSEFGCNPLTFAQHLTTPLPPGVTPASHEPTKCNYDMGKHQDYTLSPTVGQMSYGTAAYPTVSSPTLQSNATTTGVTTTTSLKTHFSELGWNPPTYTQSTHSPPGVTPASYELTGCNYDMGINQDDTLSPTIGQMSYSTAGYPSVSSPTLQSYATTTGFRTSFSDLGYNPLTCSQYIPPHPPSGVTAASYEPTRCNYDMGIHQDYTLSPMVGQMSYGAAAYPSVSSPILQSNTTTTGFSTRCIDLGCNPSTCSQYMLSPPPPGVTPASYEPTGDNYDMGIHQDYILHPTVGQMSYGTPDHPIVNNSNNFLSEDRFSKDLSIEDEYISRTSSVNFANFSTNNENLIEEFDQYLLST